MAYNPHISAAKREAKLRVRTTGASHQVTLDEVAREAGAADWNSFLLDPRPIREATPSAECATKPSVDHASERTSPRKRRVRWLISVTVAVVIVATAAVAERSLATRSNMQAINDDVVHSTMIHFTGHDRDTAVTSLVRDADGLRLTVMVTDGRPFALSERMSYRMIMPEAFGGRAFTYAKEAHLVTRFSGRLHCSKRLMMPDRVEVADSYRGPAAWSHPIMIPISRRVPWRLAGDTMDRLCSTPGRGEIVQRIPR